MAVNKFRVMLSKLRKEISCNRRHVYELAQNTTAYPPRVLRKISGHTLPPGYGLYGEDVMPDNENGGWEAGKELCTKTSLPGWVNIPCMCSCVQWVVMRMHSGMTSVKKLGFSENKELQIPGGAGSQGNSPTTRR